MEYLIKDYNDKLSTVYKFENDWYSLVYRCCGCHSSINRKDLSLDVCSELILLGTGKLKNTVADITKKSEMIKYLSKCAKYSALKLMTSQSFFLPSISRHEKKVRNSNVDNVTVSDEKEKSRLQHGETLKDLEFIISNKAKEFKGAATNKYKLAYHIISRIKEDYNFPYTSLANNLGVCRSTVEAAMTEVRSAIVKLDSNFFRIQDNVRSERIRRKVELAKMREEKSFHDEEESWYEKQWADKMYHDEQERDIRSEESVW